MSVTQRILPNINIPRTPPNLRDPQALSQHLDQMARAIANHYHPTPPHASGDFPMVLATDFGVVGDGVADDTAALQAALDFCGSDGVSTRRVLYCGNMTCKISGPLVCLGLGVVFESGGQFGAGLYPTGSGYTAITFGNNVQLAQVRISVFGNGHTVNGVLFDQAVASTVERVMVMDCNGYGVKIQDCFDVVFQKISTLSCGNASNYAIDIGSNVDTTNECHFVYLQCEIANTKAIRVDDGALMNRFSLIHSEQANAVAGTLTWSLGGARSYYGPCRLHANTAANASIRLAGEHSTFSNINVESTIPVKLVGLSFSTITLIEPFFQGTVSVDLTGHSGRINIHGGDLGTLATDLEDRNGIAMVLYGVRVGTMNLGIIGGNPAITTNLQCFGCSIGTLTSSSTLSGGHFVDCVIEAVGTMPQYATKFRNCKIANGSTITIGSGYVEMTDCVVTAAVSVSSGMTLNAKGTLFQGGLALVGTRASLLVNCAVSSSLSGIGVPTGGPQAGMGTSGNFTYGHQTDNIGGTSGAPSAWVCVTPGAPGTWKPLANIP